MQMRSCWIFLPVSLGVLLNPPANSQAGPISYRYTLLADTGGPFDGFGPSVPLDGQGTAAFFASLSTGGFGIFPGSGGPITIIADTPGPLTLGFGGITIKNAGTVAFPSRGAPGGSSLA